MKNRQAVNKVNIELVILGPMRRMIRCRNWVGLVRVRSRGGVVIFYLQNAGRIQHAKIKHLLKVRRTFGDLNLVYTHESGQFRSIGRNHYKATPNSGREVATYADGTGFRMCGFPAGVIRPLDTFRDYRQSDAIAELAHPGLRTFPSPA